MMMKSAINWEALMDRIKDVEGIEDDCKFKRLHLFLTEENIERANDILTNAKKGGEGHTDNLRQSVAERAQQQASQTTHSTKT